MVETVEVKDVRMGDMEVKAVVEMVVDLNWRLWWLWR